MGGVSDHLFAPTRTATRETLAVTLYRLAGRPSASRHPLMDVEPDTEAYRAVCWAMDHGLFLEAAAFFPEMPVSREMLSAVLLRYYTEILGYPVTALTGLGGYSDGSDVSNYAKLPMGWALCQGILTDRDGLLRPQAAVSRGQLAEALHALRKIT